ncbi:MAG: 4-hydroxythreonine-4-phosphate dehydrogenase PdxA [Deltaproteobacteria bacterium]|nr:4-hydroxythreonine-4-phosphate dehydrogenase PdxA [Candidatus Anaeroferrophillus wilburensis]MBN2889482.1 4-hydroxythreonine-4-phosphate dehydrogenase PdxA [Deltaproteobacteria bacterium]
MERMITPDVLAVTMGDPAGIGPEIVVKSWLALAPAERRRLLLIGDQARLNKTAQNLGCHEQISFVQAGREHAPLSRRSPAIMVPVLNPLEGLLPDLPLGVNHGVYGMAAFSYVKKAVELAMAGRTAGLVTAPLAKRSLHVAGLSYAGHTEILKKLSGSPEVAMMFWGSRLKVVLVTTHLPLSQVAAQLHGDLLRRKIVLFHDFWQRVGAGRGKPIAVAALNPHAGEGGAFGDEEEQVIAPVIRFLSRQGLAIEGPVPADVLFHRAVAGEYDAVVALYHDQGLIPFKLLHFADGVQLTLGLPFIRTSVDHGTAFDIAGKNLADCSSMLASIRLAFDLQSFQEKKNKMGRKQQI